MSVFHCPKCDHKFEAKTTVDVLENPSEVFDKSAVIDLARAIADSGSSEAATCLDRLFRGEPVIHEWIAQARFRRAA